MLSSTATRVFIHRFCHYPHMVRELELVTTVQELSRRIHCTSLR